MECINCNKEVNKITLYCDNCGTKFLTPIDSWTIDHVDDMLVKAEFKDRYSFELEEDIKKAYYISLILKETKGIVSVATRSFFDYFFLRLLFEEDKNEFLDVDYDPQVAKEILTALRTGIITDHVKAVLKTKYDEDYRNQRVPYSIIKKVPQIYMLKDRKLNNIINGKKDISKTLLKKCKDIKKLYRKDIRVLLKKLKKRR